MGRITLTASQRLDWALKPHKSSLEPKDKVRDPFAERNEAQSSAPRAPASAHPRAE